VFSRRRRSLAEYLQGQVWPLVPESRLGRTLAQEDEDGILGYGHQGW
jgi:hypothetical protein